MGNTPSHYSDKDHQALYPGDRFFSHANSQTAPVPWGDTIVATNEVDFAAQKPVGASKSNRADVVP